jgi:serine/threonine protein kinase/Tol biopolymer transport system component
MTPKRWGQLEELYQAARALPPSERTALLERADPELRATVAAILAQEGVRQKGDAPQEDGAFLNGPAWEGRESLLKHGAPLQTETSVRIGEQLGPYRIEQKIGQGGMGEVYRARDTRLNRIVAIKVLPSRLADSAESRDRFEREARMIASLNHPHICTLHDVGHHGDMDYLVMEFLEGETLALRLSKGPLPLEQTLQYAIQIADALDKAHRRGMTHRDLKPGNIMITKSGAKLLDFGLAKLKQAVSPVEVQASEVPTAINTITAQGSIVGTLQYMAPEQLEGKETDARTDIFALGTVIYEMATGTKAFDGKSPASIIAKILETDPPPIRSLQPMTPTALDRVVKTSLAKDPDNRLQSVQDLKLELEWMRDTPAEPSTLAGVARRAGWRRALPWALSAAALLLVVFAWVLRTAPNKAVPVESVRFQIAPATKHSLRLTGGLALSADGRQLAFIATGPGDIPSIWIRVLNSLEIRPLHGTESAGSLLFWSPDSRFIAFESGGKLQKIDISGGPAEPICLLSKTGVGGSWNQDGTIIFGQYGGPIMQVSAAGGVAAPLTVLDTPHGDIANVQPYFLPDGRHFLYVRGSNTDGYISVGSLDAKPAQQDSSRLLQASGGAAYAPPSDSGFGQLLFLRGLTLMAQQFDTRNLKISGDPVRVVEEPLAPYWATGAFSVSTNGTLAYWPLGGTDSQLTWFDARGKVLSTVGQLGTYTSVALSPDGARAFVSRIGSGGTALWQLDLSRGTSTRFELDPSVADDLAVWAPDGRSIIFASSRAGEMMDIYKKQLTGSADAEAMFKSSEWKTPRSWSPDGRFLLYVTEGSVTKYKLWLLPLEAGRKPVPFLRSQFEEPDGRFSPDGRWVAYVTNESGRYDVYVRPFSPDQIRQGISSAGGKWLISDNGGSSPMWRQDGKELYYIDLDGKLMEVSLTAGSDFKPGVPRALFQAPPRVSGDSVIAQWAPSPDGKRFLFLVPETQETPPFTVVLNWHAGLKK